MATECQGSGKEKGAFPLQLKLEVGWEGGDLLFKSICLGVKAEELGKEKQRDERRQVTECITGSLTKMG